MTSAPLLDATDVRTVFHTPRGAMRAVDGVSLTLEQGRPWASSASPDPASPYWDAP
ncbi:hypothetical protein NKH18_46145 [Streptomyces sp. M10(2022)]